jgi:hypothetical protein
MGWKEQKRAWKRPWAQQAREAAAQPIFGSGYQHSLVLHQSRAANPF